MYIQQQLSQIHGGSEGRCRSVAFVQAIHDRLTYTRMHVDLDLDKAARIMRSHVMAEDGLPIALILLGILLSQSSLEIDINWP